jgi:phenylalanine-4-hydroxylase
MLSIRHVPCIKEPVMSDNLHNRGPQDRSRINVHEEWEVAYWTKELGLSKEELEAKAAGPSVSAVREHLGK